MTRLVAIVVAGSVTTEPSPREYHGVTAMESRATGDEAPVEPGPSQPMDVPPPQPANAKPRLSHMEAAAIALGVAAAGLAVGGGLLMRQCKSSSPPICTGHAGGSLTMLVAAAVAVVLSPTLGIIGWRKRTRRTSPKPVGFRF